MAEKAAGRGDSVSLSESLDAGTSGIAEWTSSGLGTVFLFWPPQRVRETSPHSLGVAIPGDGQAGAALNPYVPRDVDHELDAALDRGHGTVLLIAEPGSGAKRTAFEALVRRRPDSPLLIPRTPLPEDPETLFASDIQEYEHPVLWLADAVPMLDEPAVDLLLRPPYRDVTVLGIIRPDALEQVRSSGLDGVAIQVHVPGELSETERAEAGRLYPHAEFSEGVSAGEIGNVVRGAAERPRTPVRLDHVYTLPDAPAPVDLLGRKPLAESLAIRFRTMRAAPEDRGTSFLLHIDGPWGAGKSSLLNYLRDELTKDSLVVDFNAWREQRVGPPWLGLLMALRRAAFARDGWSLRVRELVARARTMGYGYLAALLLTAGITAALVLWAAAGDLSPVGLGDAAKSVAALAALATTVWTITVGVSRGLLPGSPRQARRYVEGHADPMKKVADHFDRFLRLVKEPVVVFIDDLDRCAEEYVVEFLEAVQTLVRDAPGHARHHDAGGRDAAPSQAAPYFVVAADGRWIRASYEKAYASFADHVSYPGRPLGYLFLEKAFQLTTNLPAIEPDRRQEYMDYLLRVQDSADPLVEHESDIQRADEALKDAHTEGEVLGRLERYRAEPPSFRHALVGEAVKRMARSDVTERLEHALRGYADLLDPNPRAMKRFVNAYGVERALRTIERRHPPLHHLARWTVLLLRWPELADVLRNDPAAVDLIGTSVRGEVGDDVRQLFTDPDVIRVVKGTDPRHGEPLDAAAVRECAGLPPA